MITSIKGLRLIGSRWGIVLLLYVLIFTINIFFQNGLSPYNYVTLSVSFVFLFVLFPIKQVVIEICLYTCMFIFVLLFNIGNILYMVNDLLMVSFVLLTFSIAQLYVLNKYELNLIKNVFVGLMLLSFVLSLFPHYYSIDKRFEGILMSGNLSSSVVTLLIIFVWEVKKMFQRGSKVLLILLTIIFIYFFIISKTRTLLFAFPYFIYQFMEVFGRRRVLLLLMLLVFISLFYSIYLVKGFRLNKDGSFLTREFLYMAIFEKIIDNYFVLPHGFNAAKEYVVALTKEKSFSPHNDFLRYYYDWGFVWILVLILFFYKIWRIIKMDINFILILLIVFSCALHNAVFSIYLWFPLLFILIVRKQRVQDVVLV